MTDAPKTRDALVELAARAAYLVEDEGPIYYTRVAEAILSALEAAGVRLVPDYPTGEIYEGFRSVNCKIDEPPWEEFTTFRGDFGNFAASYQGALAASPYRKVTP